MKKTLIASTLLVCMNAFAADVSVIDNLEGNYDCTGTELSSPTTFHCDESIKKTDSTYSFQAVCSNGATYEGTGIYDLGRNSLSLVFRNTANAEDVGLSVKHVKSDGALIGKWTGISQGTFGRTTCTKKASA